VVGQDKKKLKEVRQAYLGFLEDTYVIPISEWYEVFPRDNRRPKKKLDYDFCLSWLVKKGAADNQFKNEITELVGKFNRYLHPHGLKFTEMEKPDCPDCPSLVRYQEYEQKQYIRFFQDVVYLYG